MLAADDITMLTFCMAPCFSNIHCHVGGMYAEGWLILSEQNFNRGGCCRDGIYETDLSWTSHCVLMKKMHHSWECVIGGG